MKCCPHIKPPRSCTHSLCFVVVCLGLIGAGKFCPSLIGLLHQYHGNPMYRKVSNIKNPKTQKLLVSSCSCLYPISWSQVLSWEWRCSWSSTDRRCSNYICWVINNLIAYSSTKVHLILETWRYFFFNPITVSGVIWPPLPMHSNRPNFANILEQLCDWPNDYTTTPNYMGK